MSIANHALETQKHTPPVHIAIFYSLINVLNTSLLAMQEKTRGVGILTTLEGSAIPVRRAARLSIVTVLREQVPSAITRRKRAN